MFNLLIATALGFAQPTMQPIELPTTHVVMPATKAENSDIKQLKTAIAVRKTVIIIIRCQGKHCTIIIISTNAAKAAQSLQAGDQMVTGDLSYDASTEQMVFTPANREALPAQLALDSNVKIAPDLRRDIGASQQATIRMDAVKVKLH
jgi:hypothetical protein